MRIARNRLILRCLAIAALVAVAWLQGWWQEGGAPVTDVPQQQQPAPQGYPDFLPVQAHAVLDRIRRGQAHPYRQDGGVFQNRERRLPDRPRGHYREYTVPTPGARDRGARRIVTGGDPPLEFWYTADHYRSFRSFEVPR